VCNGGILTRCRLRVSVIAIDIDPAKLEMARHNAEIYGVADRIEFICGDFVQLAPHIIADVIFLSPPWGGPQYLTADVYDIESCLAPIGGTQLYHIANKITKNIGYYLPRNVNTDQVSIYSSFTCLAAKIRVATQIPPKNSLTFPGFSRSF